MYKLIKITTLSNQVSECIKDLTANKFIPLDENNLDYQEYLKWVAQGNTPEPADEPA